MKKIKYRSRTMKRRRRYIVRRTSMPRTEWIQIMLEKIEDSKDEETHV